VKRRVIVLSLDELPDVVYAPLGTRGVQPLPLKECPRCGNKVIEQLHVVSERKGSREKKDPRLKAQSVAVDEFDISCGKCDYNFTIRCENVYSDFQGKERVITFVHIITEDGANEGWLGNY
jgi:ribosomal protein S27AE